MLILRRIPRMSNQTHINHRRLPDFMAGHQDREHCRHASAGGAIIPHWA
jgi:hypothetical protein